MPNTTGQGITYPISTDTVHTTDDLATLANSVDSQLATDRALRDGVWSLYTATITGATSGTWGAGTATVSTYYTRIGHTVIVNGNIIFGSSTSVAACSGPLLVSLPIATRAVVPADVGAGLILDATPTSRQRIACELSGTTSFLMVADASTIVINSSPWTWAVNDEIRFHLIYEAATLP